jgi:hypothetical protein
MFGVVKNKIMYGKKVKGIERSTFLIGADGLLKQEWRGLKVPGHVEEVLKAVKDLKKAKKLRLIPVLFESQGSCIMNSCRLNQFLSTSTPSRQVYLAAFSLLNPPNFHPFQRP